MDFSTRRYLPQRLLDLLAGIDAGGVEVAEVVDVGRDVEAVDVLGGAVKERQARVATGDHQRDVKLPRDRIDDAGERVLFQPNLNVSVDVVPQRFAVEPCGLFERALDA